LRVNSCRTPRGLQIGEKKGTRKREYAYRGRRKAKNSPKRDVTDARLKKKPLKKAENQTERRGRGGERRGKQKVLIAVNN